MSIGRVVPAILAVMASVGVVWGAVLVGFLFAGVTLVPFGVAVGVEAALVVPGFVFGVLTGGRRFGRRADPRRLLRILPLWMRRASAVLFFGFWVSAATGFIGVGGQAEIQNGQYVLDDHGAITAVDKATYDRQLAQQERIFVSGLGGFGVGAATLCLLIAVRPVSGRALEQHGR